MEMPIILIKILQRKFCYKNSCRCGMNGGGDGHSMSTCTTFKNRTFNMEQLFNSSFDRNIFYGDAIKKFFPLFLSVLSRKYNSSTSYKKLAIPTKPERKRAWLLIVKKVFIINGLALLWDSVSLFRLLVKLYHV